MDSASLGVLERKMLMFAAPKHVAQGVLVVPHFGAVSVERLPLEAAEDELSGDVNAGSHTRTLAEPDCFFYPHL